MKRFDFTNIGGFPLTQDRMKWVQDGYMEALEALAMVAVDEVSPRPLRLKGMDSFVPSTGRIGLSGGAFFYNGEICLFEASAVDVPLYPDTLLVTISDNATGLLFKDGVSRDVQINRRGTLTVGLPVTDANTFTVSDMVGYEQALAVKMKESTTRSITVNTPGSLGGVTGTIQYKKMYAGDLVAVSGTLTANNALNFNASPGALFYVMGTLASGYRPVATQYFVAQYFAGNMFLNDSGVQYIKQLTGTVSTDGSIRINWIKPDAAISGYSICFNFVMQLDM
jgi:hypothetical protein